MAEPAVVLPALLTKLQAAVQNGNLVIDQSTLSVSGGDLLLQTMREQLRTASFTLANVVLPQVVIGDRLDITGTGQNLTVTCSFHEIDGEIAVHAVFEAGTPALLLQVFPVLPTTFFDALTTMSEASATITIPGLVPDLAFAAPRYGVVALALPSSGLVITSRVPRLAGQVTAQEGPKALLIELETETSFTRVAPPPDAPAGDWGFADLAWLMDGLGLLARLAELTVILPATGLALRSFELILATEVPELSAVTIEIADLTDPTQPLWQALDGKIKLTDVVVTLDLTPGTGLALAGSGTISGDFSIGTLALSGQIPFPQTGEARLSAFPNLSLAFLDDLESLLPDAARFADILPEGLSALASFQLSYVDLAIDIGKLSLAEFSFTLRSTETWTLIPPDIIELDGLNIRMTIRSGADVTGVVTGSFGLPHDAQVTVSLGRHDARQPWDLNVISPAIPLPGLGDLAKIAQDANLAGMVSAGGLDKLAFVMTDLHLGATIRPNALNAFGVTLRLADTADPLALALNWDIIPDVLTLTGFSFGFEVIRGANPSKTVFGTFVLNGLKFDIRFAQGDANGEGADALIAEYHAEGAAGSVTVKDLITSLSPHLADAVPDGLTINLADALLAYININKTPKYVFGIDISVEMPLSDLPLIGNSIPADAKAGLKNLKIVIASDAMSPEDVATINAISPAPVLPLPAAGATGPAIPKGLSVVAELQLGQLSILMSSPPPQTPSAASMAATMAITTATADPTMWIEVQKNFGPVSIQKVGFSYRDGALFAVANLSLAVGPLEIDLLGVGIGSPIEKPKLNFTISGADITLAEGPVEVAGGLAGTIDPVNLYGEMMLKVPEYAIGAIAGFAVVEDHPSFFLYGMRLDPPLGGPAFAFVTGVAAGVGFNRKLVIPAVDGVASFPFVEWAMGKGAPSAEPDGSSDAQVAGVLERLVNKGVVAPQVGDYWLAAGVHFSSFGLVDSFALLTASFGADFEIDLLGMSRLTLPPVDPKDESPPEPVALVELQLKASFSQQAGLLAISGQLTPNSYVLSKACHLTGGFAFYSWFSGDREGDFVLTMGGYSGRFVPPPYFPVVPRLGLRWQVTDQLTITGDEYFALTSTCVMAGGGLSAVWDGGPVSAWFTVEVDFLLVYKPFHYYLSATCQLGASFSIDLLFTTVTMTIHLGVGIEIWGPEFAGRAEVDLSIISFTIEFNGGSPQDSTKIPWHDFVEQLLPRKSQVKTQLDLQGRRVHGDGTPLRRAARHGMRRGLAAAPMDDASPVKPAVVVIKVTDGLVKTLNDTAETGVNYVVDGQHFQVEICSAIPIKDPELGKAPNTQESRLEAASIDVPDELQPKDKSGNIIPPTTAFGVGPVGLDDGPKGFTSILAVDIVCSEATTFHAIRLLKNVPKAFWKKPDFPADKKQGPKIDDPLNDTTIKNALVGFRLIPFAEPADRTPCPIDKKHLEYQVDENNIERFNWSSPALPQIATFPGVTVADTIGGADPGYHAPANRDALLRAIRQAGLPVASAIDAGDLAKAARTYLADAPMMALLGAAS
jgi:hypothetical protein